MSNKYYTGINFEQSLLDVKDIVLVDGSPATNQRQLMSILEKNNYLVVDTPIMKIGEHSQDWHCYDSEHVNSIYFDLDPFNGYFIELSIIDDRINIHMYVHDALGDYFLEHIRYISCPRNLRISFDSVYEAIEYVIKLYMLAMSINTCGKSHRYASDIISEASNCDIQLYNRM